MIRSNAPLPFLYRLRLQASSAARRAQSSLVHYRQPRAALTEWGRIPRQAAARRGGSGDAAQLWQEFIAQYERFTGVLCAAAMSGCDARKESEYAQTRRWFVANYYRMAARMRPYLEAEFAAAQMPDTHLIIEDYAGQKRALDTLEALFLPPTLKLFLRQDTGDLIPRIAQVSDAVYRCHGDWKSGQRA